MAKSTTNYGLIKPEAGDAVSVTPHNTNMDTIDAALKTLDSRTGAGIPISVRDTRNIGTVLAEVEARTGTDIPVSAQDSRSIKAALSTLDETVTGIGVENVKYTQGQGLTETQQGYARDNIAAAAAADVTAIQTEMSGKYSSTIPYNVLEVSATYPLPIVDAGYGRRMENACHLFRFGPIVIVSFAFDVTAEVPAGQRIIGFYSGFEAASGMHCAAQLTANDGTSVYSLYRDGEGMATPLVIPTGFYRGFAIYGLASTLWPIAT